MKKPRFTETQIVKAIQEHENVCTAEDVFSKHFINLKCLFCYPSS